MYGKHLSFQLNIFNIDFDFVILTGEKCWTPSVASSFLRAKRENEVLKREIHSLKAKRGWKIDIDGRAVVVVGVGVGVAVIWYNWKSVRRALKRLTQAVNVLKGFV